jgi:VLRF1 release factor-like protein
MLSLQDYRLSRQKLQALLDRLETTDQPGWSLYLPDGLKAGEIENMLKEVPGLAAVNPDASKLAGSATGSVIFWGEKEKYILRPPFPVKTALSAAGFQVKGLREIIAPDYLVALILIRLGAYGIGVFKGETRLRSKVGTGLVHARHKKGGSSANRFARHREKQAETFFTRVGGHLREKLEPDLRALDYIIYGGEKATVASFRKQCAFTRQLDSRTLGYLLNVRVPRQTPLEEAIIDVYSSRVWRWKETG